jgi:hypothetical protein
LALFTAEGEGETAVEAGEAQPDNNSPRSTRINTLSFMSQLPLSNYTITHRDWIEDSRGLFNIGRLSVFGEIVVRIDADS